MIARAAVVAEARAWIGTRWRHQACFKGVGVDCVGLVGGVAVALGLPGAKEWASNPVWHQYGRKPDPKTLLAGCDAFMDRIHLAAAREGDVLVMHFRADPQHFAIISEPSPLSIIHAFAQARRVTEARVDELWRGRVVRAYAYRGIT